MRVSPYRWTPADMIGGSPALDFVNSVSGWTSDPADRIGGPHAFAGWAAVAGLADAKGRKRMTREIAARPMEAAALYEGASALRAALHRIFTAISGGRAAAPADLARLAEWTARAAAASTLAIEKGAIVRRWRDDESELARALFGIAQAAETFILNGPLDRLHLCGGAGCGWMFVDRSKNGQRRWCSMATCGNAAKVKTFRRRKKGVASG